MRSLILTYISMRTTNSKLVFRAIHCFLNFFLVVNHFCIIAKMNFWRKIIMMHFILIYHLYAIYLNIYHPRNINIIHIHIINDYFRAFKLIEQFA